METGREMAFKKKASAMDKGFRLPGIIAPRRTVPEAAITQLEYAMQAADGGYSDTVFNLFVVRAQIAAITGEEPSDEVS